MAEHKVPQNVEADDKLLGPFSMRQFIYLMIAFGAGAAAFFLGQQAVPLALIPLPIMIFFGVLALPLRKDQPMEVYLAALFKYYFNSRIRIWQPDGEMSMVEISNPVVDDSPKTKELKGEEVSRRLSFLANIADTQGWSTRGVSAVPNNTNLNDDLAMEAAMAPDMLEDSTIADSLNDKLGASEQQVRAQALLKMYQLQQQSAQTSAQTMTPKASYTYPTYPVSQAPSLNSASPLPNYNYNYSASTYPQPQPQSQMQTASYQTPQVLASQPQPVTYYTNSVPYNSPVEAVIPDDLINKVVAHKDAAPEFASPGVRVVDPDSGKLVLAGDLEKPKTKKPKTPVTTVAAAPVTQPVATPAPEAALTQSAPETAPAVNIAAVDQITKAAAPNATSAPAPVNKPKPAKDDNTNAKSDIIDIDSSGAEIDQDDDAVIEIKLH